MDTMIASNPKVMMGKPVIAGTRITVESILERLGGGETIEDLLEVVAKGGRQRAHPGHFVHPQPPFHEGVTSAVAIGVVDARVAAHADEHMRITLSGAILVHQRFPEGERMDPRVPEVVATAMVEILPVYEQHHPRRHGPRQRGHRQEE
jgi:hypothetical protein